MSTTMKNAYKWTVAYRYIVTIVTEEHGAGNTCLDDIDSTAVGTINEAKTYILDSVKRVTDDQTVIDTVETKLTDLGAPFDTVFLNQGDDHGMFIHWAITTLA